MRIHLPNSPRLVWERLEQAGYAAYLVGGCVRDSLRGCPPEDWDIATNARPEQVSACFEGFSVLATGIRHGTVTVLVEGEPVEVTTFRVDGQYTDHRRPDSVVFVDDLREDLARRDFTVNAMAYHPRGGVVDYFGGVEDLRAGRIACVGDPAARFGEDALRVLRAVRFASVLDFEVEPATAAAMRDCAPLLDRVAAERVRAELDKAVMGPGVRRAFSEHAAVLARIFPALSPEADPAGWETTLAAVERAGPDRVVRLALLLGGLGERAGETLARLRYDNQTACKVKLLVTACDGEISPKEAAIRRWLNRLGEEGFRRLLELRRAQCPDEDLTAAWRALDKVLAEGQCYRLSDLAVGGDDLLAVGVPRGKRVGELLAALLDGVLDGRLPNDRAALLAETSCLLEPGKEGERA